MPRRPQHTLLRVLLNNRLVGRLSRAPSGAIAFQYAQEWLDREHALPVSLSLPLREDAYHGAPVVAVFDNLLPDSDDLRRRVADRVGAAGTDAYSMLAAIGHDCVGALQFVVDDDEHRGIAPENAGQIHGQPVNTQEIEGLLHGLAQAPLGLSRDDPFRISMAGAQEKTALTRHEGQWLKPYETTATTHIFKTQIGTLPNGIDLTNSIENEYYCLKLASAFGLPVNDAAIQTFGSTKALVITRFDRRWTQDGRLLRLPQEDCCQALSVPPTQKYQSEGGPALIDILRLLRGCDEPERDQSSVLKAQIFFWLIGATDGHAKNFSLFLTPGGRYSLTPLYDILTAEPNVKAGQIQHKQMRLAMSVGDNNHYRFGEITGRHFIQTGLAAGLPRKLIYSVIDEIASTSNNTLKNIEAELPRDFPAEIHDTVNTAVMKRARGLESAMADEK